MKNTWKIYIPIGFVVAVILGFLLGIRSQGSPDSMLRKGKSFNMLNAVLDYIEQDYVDSVDRASLEDKTVTYLLQELDPHSYYISAEEYAAMNEPLEGNFDGIGIQFNIQRDTLVVIEPLGGGPSEKVGIKAGDRIIEVDGRVIAGVDIKNSEILKLLKGPKGTKVNVTIKRKNSDNLNFTITRDKIPIHSVNVGYMLNDTTGYIKISRFAKNTYDEFVSKGHALVSKGAKKFVIDLRGNGGGYMDAATSLLDEFFGKDVLLVYTEGRKRPKRSYYSTSGGDFKNIGVVVLIDEGSASASEIFAGAIQDNDRGLIIGRRSFGKGLVQEQTNWPNGAATRLTIARYYTPSGRSIQKPYNKGSEDYNEEYYHRYDSGELLNKDSIHVADSSIFKTESGRKVYGSGGIVPDVFVPLDTSGGSIYLNRLIYSGAIYDFAFSYADVHRSELLQYKSIADYQKKFVIDNKILDKLVEFAADKGTKKDIEGLNRSKSNIARRLKAYIARNIWNDKGFYPIWNEEDAVIKASMENRNSLPASIIVYHAVD